MKRLLVGVATLSVGCAGAASSDVARSEVTLTEPLPSSAVATLGVTETTRGTAPDSERLVRGVTKQVAACLRSALEREPGLRGQLLFHLELADDTSVAPPRGDLAGTAMATCVAGALTSLSPPPHAAGTIDYALTFSGHYNAEPLREGLDVRTHWVGFDWSASDTQVPSVVSEAADKLREPIRRCAYGAEPVLDGDRWFVLRVGKGGAPTLGEGAPGLGGDRDDEAAQCLRRTLGAATFPDAGHDYALSVYLSPESPLPPVGHLGDGAEFGMIGLLNAGEGSDPNAPTAPWLRDDSLGTDPLAARGNMWGDAIGDSFGTGGLGLAGIGEGGRGEGIGLGSIGTIGHGAGTGTGQGFGSGNGRLGGAHTKDAPKIKMGATSVSGRLPPEVIQRIVRQNFGRFRLCYELGLKSDPKLEGKVSIAFQIERNGSTTKVKATSELKDKAMLSCIEKAFHGLSFPQPEGGIVKVVYPILFSPGDAAPATPAARTIGGRPLATATLDDVDKRLTANGLKVARIPGSTDAPAPVVFASDSGSVYAITLGSAQGTPSNRVCRFTAADRTLTVHGKGCEAILSRTLD